MKPSINTELRRAVCAEALQALERLLTIIYKEMAKMTL